ncbi:MAG: DUF1150 family protein [Alphaproteobacteria bacterium]
MNKQFDAHNDPRHMTADALLALGGPNLAFIKYVDLEGEKGYGIHGADGTVLALAETRELAFAAALQHDLNPVSVH